MVSMTLDSSDLGAGDGALSTEAQETLDNYNDIFTWFYKHKHKKNKDIEAALETLLTLFPKHPALLLRRGQHYLKQYNYHAACEDLALLLEQEPCHAEALLMRIQIYHEEEQYTALLHDLNQFLAQEPDHIEMLLRRVRVRIYHKKNQDTELLHDLNHLLNHLLSHHNTHLDREMFDNHIALHFWRAELYLRQDESSLALLDLAYVIDHVFPDQDHHDILCYYYGALNARSKIYKAEDELAKELADLNALLTPPIYRSQKHVMGKPYGNVHQHSQRALYRRSEIHVAQNNIEAAHRDLRRLLSQNPLDAPALIAREQLYTAQGQHALAFEDEFSSHDAMLHTPVYQRPKALDAQPSDVQRPLMIIEEALDVDELEQGKLERVLPSLKACCRMTFFRHEAYMDTSAFVAADPRGVDSSLKNSKIRPEYIQNVRIWLHAEEAGLSKTIFEELEPKLEELETHEMAAHDWDVGASSQVCEKRKHEEISSDEPNTNAPS